MNTPQEPWGPTDATYCIREIGRHPALSVAYKLHAMERSVERGIKTSDVLYLLRKGFVYETANPSKTAGYYKYKVVGTTPNSDGRDVAIIVIPNASTMKIKLVTVYWVDEDAARAGSILCEEDQ